jgi:inorganic pyrophosphatase
MRRGGVPVVVECPKGSRWRILLGPAGAPVRLRRLPDGVRYPCNYGYVPGTLAADGDALDAIWLGKRRLPIGCRAYGHVVGGLMFRDGRGEDPKLLVAPGPRPATAPDLGRWEARLRRFFAAYKPAGEAPEVGERVPAETALAWLDRARRHGQGGQSG